MTKSDSNALRLYSEPIRSRRSGPLYNAFSYPTKINPEVIGLFIAAHTKPGETVLDVFGGSGTTGLAARLCANPTSEMRRRADELGLSVEWGPRNAIVYELSVVGSLLARTMCAPPDPAEFADSAKKILKRVTRRYGWMYEVEAPDGSAGCLRHAIWSELLLCGHCNEPHSFWDLAVQREPLSLRKTALCPSCGSEIDLGSADRATEALDDPLTSERITSRVRHLAHMYGRTGRKTWKRPPNASDSSLIDRVYAESIPASVPSTPLRWGDLHRSGYHQGIERVHHFYSRRNLIAMGALWEEIENERAELRDALRLLALSYNAAHATLMTRVVVKRGMSDFALTGAQSGVLYVSSLPTEKNVFAGVRRKVNTFRAAFAASQGGRGEVEVVNASSTSLDLPDRSVDYVFTDPPFGGFIPYAEINQINEAWLGSLTDDSEEAIISPAQGKGVDDYGALMSDVFKEVARVLREDGRATVVFHSSKPDVWAAVGDAFMEAEFVVEKTSLLDKTQVSFKQVVSSNSTRGDAIFLLARGSAAATSIGKSEVRTTIRELRAEHGSGASIQHLYSRYVAHCMKNGVPVEVTAKDFQDELSDLQAAGT